MARDKVTHCLRSTSIRNVRHVRACHHLEELAGGLMRAPVPAGRHIDFARILLGVGNQIGDRRYWERRVHHDDIVSANESGDRSNVACEVRARYFYLCTGPGFLRVIAAEFESRRLRSSSFFLLQS